MPAANCAGRAPGIARPRNELAAAGTVRTPPIARSHEPTLIGEVTLKTRSMLRKRSGLPRSEVSRSGLTESAPNAISQERRASSRLPVRAAASANVADAPPRPPVKKEVGVSQVQTGGLTTGFP